MSATMFLVHSNGSLGPKVGLTYNPAILPDIPEDMVLSFHSTDFAGIPGASGQFMIGTAFALVRDYYHNSDGSWAYDVTIEAEEADDYSAALREIFRRLGRPVDDLTPPVIHPTEQSFVRGVSNDVRRLTNMIATLVLKLRRQAGLRLFR